METQTNNSKCAMVLDYQKSMEYIDALNADTLSELDVNTGRYNSKVMPNSKLITKLITLTGVCNTNVDAKILQDSYEYMVDQFVDIISNTDTSLHGSDSLYNILTEVKQRCADMGDTTVAEAVIDTIDEYMAGWFGNIAYYVGNVHVVLDNGFLGDWISAKNWIAKNKLEAVYYPDLNRVAKGVITGLLAKTSKATILTLDNNKFRILYKILVGLPLIYHPIFALKILNKPGIYSIKPSDPEYGPLASLVNKYEMTVFNLHINNQHRIDGSVTVFFNKTTQAFSIWV